MKIVKAIFLQLFVFTISIAQETPEIKWWNPAINEFPVIAGQYWPDEVKSVYHRLPERAEENVRKAVWNLSTQSAGLSIRFWTNAKSIRVKYKVTGNVAMPHMPSTGVSGLDLYGKSHDGKWMRCWDSYSIDRISDYNFIIDENSDAYHKHGREYQLFLPLYNEVETLEIGVSKKSSFEVLPIRKEKPVVAYGTSICQGACASRPGMAWTNILERKLERPVINLGFSGNGRLEPELIDLMSEIEAKVYILDCLPNLNPDKDETYALTLNAVKRLKEKRPEVPVILTAHIGYANELTNQEKNDKHIKLNKALNRAFNTLISEGYTSIFLLQKEDLALGFDSYVDNIHPNDFGMIQYANAYEDLIREITEEPKGSLSTTIPATQSRDIAVYKWEDRHQEILALNKINPPKICLFGNSIINFWGGEPKSSIARGQDSWKSILELMGVQNFGFGWDRIENVLWRVYHDELDGFDAEQVILMIGTNNLHLNTDVEIIKGLEELIEAIRIRQPFSNLRMIGILPRSGTEDRIRKLNFKISQLAELEDIDYKDIGNSLLLDNGKIDDSLFVDGLHPNKMGYMLMAKELAIFLSSGCKAPSEIADSETKDWQIIWEDNFDGPELDTSKWTRIPPNNADWGKHMTIDQQCYRISEGKLFLKGIVNPDTLSDSRPFLTGGIYTKGKFAFQYGKIEIRVELECAQGAWPAIWMLAEKNKYGPYPRNGEIDIMEHLNFEDIIYQTTHSYYTLELKQKDNPPYYGTTKVDIDQFNTYGLEWYPDKLVFTLNGKETFVYPKVDDVDPSQWPYDQPFYLLVDQQLGGSWVGEVNPDDLPVQMIVDFVKVYQ